VKLPYRIGKKTLNLSRKLARRRLARPVAMDTRDREQTGHIYRRGRWWVLRYRIEVSVGGKVQVIQRAKRLAPVDSSHRTKPACANWWKMRSSLLMTSGTRQGWSPPSAIS